VGGERCGIELFEQATDGLTIGAEAALLVGVGSAGDAVGLDGGIGSKGCGGASLGPDPADTLR